MNDARIDRYAVAHGDIAIHLDAAAANRVLLALEHLQQAGTLDPALLDLRDNIKACLTTKSSGDTDSAPSSGV